MKPILALLLLLAMMTSCTPAAPEPEPEIVEHTYPVSADDILNPERGFFTPYTLPGPVGFSAVRATGNTLVHVNIRLDDWRETDLPQELLDNLDQNFADMRGAGVKAIIRFAYNQGPYPDSEPDASKDQILNHIEQLTPLLQKNGDVIAWAEAGFIGAWGEWHTSTNGLDNLDDKRDILHALLEALPQNRMAQVRYPANIIEMYPNPADAVKARVAHHNDCFLSSDTDVGTYERDGENTIARDQTYLAKLTGGTPMSGETCAPNPPRSECKSALYEMALLHFSAINEAYHKGILRSWEEGGCMTEIINRLGYRLTPLQAQFNEQVRPGGILNLRVELDNSGFAAPVNPRPVFVILAPVEGGSEPQRTLLDLDPRQWQPGRSSFDARLHLPANLAQGTYRLALWLPDEAPALQDDSRYALQFASDGTWDEVTGYNVLGNVQVINDAGGAADKENTLHVIEIHSTPAVATILPLQVSSPTLTPEPGSGRISDLELAHDAQTLTIRFSYSGKLEEYNGFQVFLNTNNEATASFQAGDMQANFLMENDVLYSYTGSGGDDWNWTAQEQAVVDYRNENQVAHWKVRLADIGSPTAVEVVAQLVDINWNTVDVTKKTIFPVE